ncbi:MAG: CRTAC1 family protein [Planctomycetota bacterium]
MTPIGNSKAIAHGDLDNDGDEDLYVTRGIQAMDVVAVAGQEVAFELHDRAQGNLAFRLPIAGITRIDALVLCEGHENAPHRFLGAAGSHPADQLLSFTPGDFARLRGRPTLAAQDYGVLVFVDDQDRFTIELVAAGRHDESATGKLTITGAAPVIEKLGPFVDHAPDLTNRLLQNDGQGGFSDVTSERGAGDPRSGRMSVIADFDNDGDLDIFVLNNAPFLVDEPDCLYWNDGRGTFTPVESPLPRLENGGGRPSSALALDYDGDGDLDLFITNGDDERPFNKGPYQLWRNRGANGHWLMVRLVGGKTCEPNGLGARLYLDLAGGPTLLRECDGGNTLYSQSLLPVHFGMGSQTRATRLRVRWPNGDEQVVDDVRADQVLVVDADRRAPAARESLWPYLLTWGILGSAAFLIVRQRSQRP